MECLLGLTVLCDFWIDTLFKITVIVLIIRQLLVARFLVMVCCVAGSRPDCDHVIAGCGGPTLMLANLYRLPKKR